MFRQMKVKEPGVSDQRLMNPDQAESYSEVIGNNQWSV